MESIGLMPSDTGEPGGKKTGQLMLDYPIPGGRFFHACLAFSAAGYHLPYVDSHHLPPFSSTQIRQVSEALLQSLTIDNEIEDTPLQMQMESAKDLLSKPFSE